MNSLRILGRVVTFTTLAGGTFLILAAAFSGGGQATNLVGSVGGCVFWLAIIFDRRLKRKKEERRLPREPSSLPQAASGSLFNRLAAEVERRGQPGEEGGGVP